MINEEFEYQAYIKGLLPPIIQKKKDGTISVRGIKRTELILARHFLFLPDAKGNVLNPKVDPMTQIIDRVNFAKKAVIAYLSPAHLTPGFQAHNDELTAEEVQAYSDVLEPEDPEDTALKKGRCGKLCHRILPLAKDLNKDNPKKPIVPDDVSYGIIREDFVETLSAREGPLPKHYANHYSSTQTFLSLVMSEALRLGPLDRGLYEFSFSEAMILRIYQAVVAEKSKRATPKSVKAGDDKKDVSLLLLEYAYLAIEDLRQIKREVSLANALAPEGRASAFFHDFSTPIFIKETSKQPKALPSLIESGDRSGGNSSLRRIVTKKEDASGYPADFAIAILDPAKVEEHPIRYSDGRLYFHDTGLVLPQGESERTSDLVLDVLQPFFDAHPLTDPSQN